VTLRSADGRSSMEIVYRPNGTGYVVRNDLAPLRPGRTYQLWALSGKQAISAGLLGARVGIAPFTVRGPVDGFAVTDERASGVTAPTSRPVVAGTI
jgi:hypothetical protein